MFRRWSAALLAAAAGGAAAASTPPALTPDGEPVVTPKDAALQEEAGLEQEPRRPEAGWLTKNTLTEMLTELGYKPSERVNYVTVPLRGKDESDQERTVYMWWSDLDSFSISASWGSKQKVPMLNGPSGDAPIANQWNAQRRFSKVAVQEDPETEGSGSQLTMHMDQFVPASGGPEKDWGAVKDVVRRSLETFRHSVIEFDQYVKRSYDDWVRTARRAEEEHRLYLERQQRDGQHDGRRGVEGAPGPGPLPGHPDAETLGRARSPQPDRPEE